jgi:hypothetical protein
MALEGRSADRRRRQRASKEDSPVRLVLEFDGDKRSSFSDRSAIASGRILSGRERRMPR